MSEEGPTPPDRPARRSRSLRWHALFQRSREAIFLLDRRRKLLFVNRSWEQLTGFPLREVRGLACQHRLPKDTPPAKHALSRALRPPREVLGGKIMRVRRWLTHPRTGTYCCDVQFVPLAGADSPLAVLGKLLPVRVTTSPASTALSPHLLTLRERFAQHFVLDLLQGQVPAVARVREQVRLAIAHPCPVTIRGEPGTGNLWLARLLHFQGPVREQTFVALDCRRLPARALAAALFDEAGLPRRHDRGTLYLQEPACLPRELQARLWEAFLSEHPAGRSAGAGLAAAPGPRILAGHTIHSQHEAADVPMLEPLACALSTLSIELPPLRERLDDLPWVVEMAIDRACQNTPRRISGVSEDALHFLRAYRWPGNLRELYAVLSSACARAQGNRVEVDDLPWYVRESKKKEDVEEHMLPLDAALGEVESHLEEWRREVKTRMKNWGLEVEKRLLLRALRFAQGNKTRTAELLSISYPRLLRRMKELDINDVEGGS
jgi:DNA-binding NtrC family response regulator